MTLACEEELRVHGYADASFAVHQDMKGHTDGIISLGRGSVNVLAHDQVVDQVGASRSLGSVASEHLDKKLPTVPRVPSGARGYIPG
jgi:hypothetical protein